MSPRAFQTILVAAMGNKDRLELESRVLAAALKQSFERGDTYGVSLAHRQIFLLLKAQQTASSDANKVEQSKSPAAQADDGHAEAQAPLSESSSPSQASAVSAAPVETTSRKKKRSLPDIVWETDQEQPGQAEAQASESVSFAPGSPEQEAAPSASISENQKPGLDAYGLLQVEQSATFD